MFIPCLFTQIVSKATDVAKQAQIFSLHGGVETVTPCSAKLMTHYSFDFAQQIHYPASPQQPGALYFKTGRKCSIFGIMCEPVKRQVNFLTDEAVDTGKGANAVISMLHFFFERFGLGEERVYLHADNCCGQNKNNMMMWYLLWRVMTSRHKEINLSFMISGHTKFAPDWAFGLAKKKLAHSVLNCLGDIATSVQNSSVVNLSQLCGTEDGKVSVPMYNWSAYLTQFFKRIPHIRLYHHFKMHSGQPGILSVKKSAKGEAISIDLRVNETAIDPSILPPAVRPKGLSHDRKSYLYKEIREFVSPEHQDTVAPEPGPRQNIYAREA